MKPMIRLPVLGRIVAATFALAASAFAPPAHADVLIDNVDGLTLDADGKVERFTGVLVGDDGRVEQVFKRSQKRPTKVDYAVDGKGRVLMPGLIDSHVRLMPFGLARIAPSEREPGGQPRPEDRDAALGKAQEALLARGITAVADMGTTIEDWQTYRRAGDLGRLYIRVIAYAASAEAMILIGGPGPSPWLYDDRLRLNGLALMLDGPLASRAALLKAPYADAPAARVTPKLSDTQLKNLMSRAAMDGFQPAVEASGDKAASDLLDAIDELALTYKGERRWRLEGADVVDPAERARLGQHGAVVVMRPRDAEAGAAADARLGPARAGSAYAWKSLAGAGARLAFGSGAPGPSFDPFAGMAAAITRQDGSDQPFGGWQPQERLNREEALAAYTTGGAHAAFAEGRLGRIAKGQRADFVMVDRDPLLASPAELRQIRVLQTWVGGKLVYEASQPAATSPPASGR